MTVAAKPVAPPILFLAAEDIRRTETTMNEIIEVVEDVFVQHGSKAVAMAPRAGIYPRPESFTQALVAYVPATGAAGAKIVSVFPTNKSTDIPVTTALLILTDAETGAPRAVMDATWITAMRTGAVTAVAAKYLARRDAREVAIIGAGVQGRGNLAALAVALPGLTGATVYDLRPEATQSFLADMETTVPFEVRAVSSPQEAVERADIVVTATAVFKERTPLVHRSWLKPGALIAPLEVDRALDASLVYEPDLLVVDDKEQTLAFRDMGCFGEGLPTIHAELGEIVAAKKPGRQSESDIIVAMNVGLPIEDVAVGHRIYQHATERRLGQRLDYA